VSSNANNSGLSGWAGIKRFSRILLLVPLLACLSACGKNGVTGSVHDVISTEFHVGQAVMGEGKEIAHIDIIIGPKDGPVGVAFVNALANQKEGHSNLLAVIEKNTQVKPATVLISKVATQDTEHSVLLFGPAQAAVAKAIADAVENGVIPANQADHWVVVCGVYLHWSAKDKRKVFKNNYNATTRAIERALKGTPTIEEINKAKHEMEADWIPPDHTSQPTGGTAARPRSQN
jgi:5,6,7,8-tetrahydromethanopterin hydro-lyase